GDGPGDLLHRPVPRCGHRLCFCSVPDCSDYVAGFLHDWDWFGTPVCRADLATGLAPLSPQTRSMDGKVQDRYGVSDAGSCSLVVQPGFVALWRTCLVVDSVPGDGERGGMGFRRIRAAESCTARRRLVGDRSRSEFRLCRDP